MVKVQILVPCEHCDGEAYLPIGQAESYTGETYIRYQPCPDCHGSGSQTRWLSLEELAALLQRARWGGVRRSAQILKGGLDDIAQDPG